MNFAVDLGNTSAKCGIFMEDKLVNQHEGLQFTEVIELINRKVPKNLIISSVNQDVAKVSQHIDKKVNCLIMTSSTKTPVTNQYDTKETLGLDRLAGVVGGNQLFPNCNVLAIDAGTCITYDVVNKKNEYQGGAISPGIDMKLKALNNYTARLPLVPFNKEAELIGKSTKSSILSGVINGTLAEIKEMIRMYSSEFVDLQIVICGGNSRFLKNKLGNLVTFEPHLVLIGLNRILSYNVERN